MNVTTFGLVLTCSFVQVACWRGETPRSGRRGAPEQRAPADLPNPSTPSSPQPEPPSGPVCPRAVGAGFESLEWIPADARLIVALDLADPTLDRALEQLAAFVRERPELPIVSGMALSQLALQLAVTRPILRRGGFEPGALLLLHTDASEPVWVFRAPCDLDVTRQELERRWPVRTRGFVGGVVAEVDRSRAGELGFLGDVVFISDDRVAITPGGAGTRLARWLEGHTTSGPAIGAPRADRLGGAADEFVAIAPATVRVLMQGPGLLSLAGADGTDRGAEGGAPSAIRLRALATGVERVGGGVPSAAPGSPDSAHPPAPAGR